jgi:hypothetical protein
MPELTDAEARLDRAKQHLAEARFHAVRATKACAGAPVLSCLDYLCEAIEALIDAEAERVEPRTERDLEGVSA